MMLRVVSALLVVALMTFIAVGAADSEHAEVDVDVDGDLIVEEETLDTRQEAADAPEVDPRLTPKAMKKIISKLSPKCHKQVTENVVDFSQISDRCRDEVARRVQRYLKRLDAKEKTDAEGKKTGRNNKKSKRRSRKTKKPTKIQRHAQKKDEEYKQTLQTIVGFVATLTAVVAGAVFYINRKLKAAGMYYPNPETKATCCD